MPRQKPAAPAPRTANIDGMQPAKIKGILINRDPPKGSGWCGAEDCGHLDHKHYNQPAEVV